jgi:hypothetical protein
MEEINFDELYNETPKGESNQSNPLNEKFFAQREEWTAIINSLSLKIKKIENIAELQTEVYTHRQRALEYYHYLVSLIITINKRYRAEYAAKYDFYSFKSQVRYPNETTKVNKILSELGDLVTKKESLENMSKFIQGTISSCDNIIYGIKNRLDLEGYIRGTK